MGTHLLAEPLLWPQALSRAALSRLTGARRPQQDLKEPFGTKGKVSLGAGSYSPKQPQGAWPPFCK